MSVPIDLDARVSAVLRRRVAAKLRALAGYFAVEPELDTDDGLVEYVRLIAEQAEQAVLQDEQTLAAMLASVDRRFDAAWPSADKVASMLRRVRGELKEIDQALELAVGRPDQLPYVLEEIGDAMLALSRLGLAVGAETPLSPLSASVAKTIARLTHFEQMLASDSEGRMNKVDLWRMAKGIVASRRPGMAWRS